MKQITNSLQKCQRVFLASHLNPDGDAIGSLIALGLALKTLGIDATMYNESAIPAVYRYLPAVEKITRRAGNLDRYDAAVVLDCGDIGRVGSVAKKIAGLNMVINIDHHVTNTRFGTLQYIDTNACSTTEIIHRLIRQLGIPLEKSMATAIYTGILTDTGSFRFANTNRSSFAISEKMIALGVDPHWVARHVYGTYSLGRIKLLNLAIDSIEISQNGRLSLMTLTQDMLKKTATQPEDIDGFINYAKRIEDVKVAALIQELQNGNRRAGSEKSFHVSLRSDGNTDVAEIASAFGGGGHYSAAGFNIDTTLSKLKDTIHHLAEKL